jgi:hypothetical protein
LVFTQVPIMAGSSAPAPFSFLVEQLNTDKRKPRIITNTKRKTGFDIFTSSPLPSSQQRHLADLADNPNLKQK